MTEDSQGAGGPERDNPTTRRLIFWVKWAAFGLGAVVTASKLSGTDDSSLFTLVAFVAFAVAFVAQIAEGMLSEYGVRGTIARGSGIAAVLALLLFALSLSDPDDRCEGFEPLAGPFTVAVVDSVPLGGDQNGIEAATLEIGMSAHDALAESFPSDALGSPRDLPRMEAESGTERETFANEIADCLAADVVLYLDVTASTGRTTIQPNMFVNPGRVFGAEELAGVHALGGPIEVTSNIRNQQTLNEEVGPALRERVEIVRGFVEALQDYDRGEYGEAREHLLDVAAEDLWQATEGQEVVKLFLGNAALLAGNDAEAKAAFNEAVGIDDEYARAYLGLGEATFQLSNGGGDCGEKASTQGLVEAIGYFDEAHDAPIQPPFAHVRAKANLGAGRAYNCLGITTGITSYFDQALQRLEMVTSEYENGNGSPDVAAVAYAEVGSANWLLGSILEDACHFRDSVTAFETAAAIPARPDIAEKAESWLSAAREAHVRAEACDQAARALSTNSRPNRRS